MVLHSPNFYVLDGDVSFALLLLVGVYDSGLPCKVKEEEECTRLVLFLLDGEVEYFILSRVSVREGRVYDSGLPRKVKEEECTRLVLFLLDGEVEYLTLSGVVSVLEGESNKVLGC